MIPEERLIMIQGIYGDGKDTIAKSSLRFMADRKYFLGGIIYVDLNKIENCLDFYKKLR